MTSPQRPGRAHSHAPCVHRRAVLRVGAALALVVATLASGAADGQVIIRRGALQLRALPAARAPAATPPAGAAAADHRGPAEPFGDDAVSAALRRARQRIEEKEWSRGIDAYDEVLDSLVGGAAREAHRAAPPPPEGGEGELAEAEDPDESAAEDDDGEEPPVTLSEVLISRDEVGYFPLDAAVRRELVDLPAAARDLFARTHAAAAEQALNDALAASGARVRIALHDVGVRYPLTPAGGDAWQLLGLRELDSGRCDEAARAFDTRLELPFPSGGAAAAEVLAQAAVAHLLAGRLDLARERLDLLDKDYAEQIIPVLGQPVAAGALREHPVLRRLLTQVAKLQPLDVGSDEMWPARGGSFAGREVPLTDAALPALGSEAGWTFPPDHPEPVTNTPAPAVVAGLGSLFVRGPAVLGGQVVALDPATGKIRWLSGDGFGGGDSGSRNSALGSAGIVLYATAAHPEDALVIGIDQAVATTQRRRGGFRPGSNQLVAWQARSGKLVWKVSGERRPEVGGGSLAFLGPPVVTPAGLATPTAGPSSVSVTGVSPGGRILWHRRLYDHGTVVRYGAAIASGSGRSLAAAGDVVIATPGHGAAFALDAHTGEVRWAVRYMSRASRLGFSARWLHSRPCVTAGRVILTPEDSEFTTAVDVATGEILWERRLERGAWTPVGAHAGTFIYAGTALRALAIADGADRWSVPLTDDGRQPLGLGFIAAGRVYLPVLGAEIAVRSAADGAAIESIRLLDPRLGGDVLRVLVPFGGRLFVSRPGVVDALLPREESWTRLAESRDDPLARAVLLRAQGEPAQALQLLREAHAKLPPGRARDQARAQLVAAARETALASRDPAPVAEILAHARELVPEADDRVALELLEVELLLEREEPDTRARAAAKLLTLTRAESRTVAAADQTEVDVPTYAADLLRELYRGAEPLPAGERDAAGEDEARAAVARGASDAALARIVFQQPHLDASAAALAHLARRAEERGASAQAADLLELLCADFPALGANAALRGRVAGLRAQVEVEKSTLPSLPESLAGPDTLVPRLTVDRDDGLLAATAPGAPPSPVLFALSGQSVRIYGPSGRVLTAHELPQYPDVEDARRRLESETEEPALVWCDGARAVLFTPAGLYAFRAGPAVAPAVGSAAAGADARLATRWRNCRLMWAQTYAHPLGSGGDNQAIGFGRGISIPPTAFARAALGPGDTILALPDGSLSGVESASGKRRWADQLPAGPGGPWGRGSGVLELALASGTAFAIVDPTVGPAAKHGERLRVVAAPEPGATHANAVAGGLAVVFGGARLWVVDAYTGRLLWKTARAGCRLVRATGGELWVSDADGRLRVRALRSGRVLDTIELPGGGMAVECLPAPAASGPDAVTLVAMGHAQAGAAGVDLWILRVSRAGGVLSKRLLRSGAVVYADCPVAAADGTLLLLFNHGAADGRWYTELVRVEADGPVEEGTAAPRVVPLAKLEIEGKGQLVPPRLCLLEDGVAVGNSGGFAWLGRPTGVDGAADDAKTADSGAIGTVPREVGRGGDRQRE